MRPQHGLTLALLVLFASQGAAMPAGPLVNGGFDVGVPHFTRPDPLSEFAYDLVGSVAPGTTEASAHRSALGWSHRVLSGRAPPEGRALWSMDGTLAIEVHPADAADRTAILTQATGSRDLVGLWSDPIAVRVALTGSSGAPITMRAAYFAAEDPFFLRLSSPVVVPAGGARTIEFVFPPSETGSMSQFMLAFQATAPGTIVLDEVEVVGARLDPGPIPPRSLA